MFVFFLVSRPKFTFFQLNNSFRRLLFIWFLKTGTFSKVVGFIGRTSHTFIVECARKELARLLRFWKVHRKQRNVQKLVSKISTSAPTFVYRGLTGFEKNRFIFFWFSLEFYSFFAFAKMQNHGILIFFFWCVLIFFCLF